MEITIRPTSIEDAEALVELYSQPKAQRETLQLPNRQWRCGRKGYRAYLRVCIAM